MPCSGSAAGGTCKFLDANRPRSLPPPVAALFRSPPLSGNGRLRRLVRQILAARKKKSQKRADACWGHMISNRSAQHRVLRFHCVQHRQHGHRPGHLPPSPRPAHAPRARRCPGNSTRIMAASRSQASAPRPNNTAGKSRTIGAQLSPASGRTVHLPAARSKIYATFVQLHPPPIASRSTFT